MLSELLAFLALSAVVICTPGPDTALTVRNAVVGGQSGGVWTAAGVAAGQAVWTVAASLGAASVLRASQPAFLGLKILGVAYLLYLGAQSLGAAWSKRAKPTGEAKPASGLAWRRAFRQGLLNNLANPKMAVFFMSLLPQFLPTDRSGGTALAAFLLLGFLFCLLTFLWLAAYSVLIAKGRRLLDRPWVRRGIDAVAGCVLIGFGVRLAFAGQSR